MTAFARALPAETNPSLPAETTPIAVTLSSLAGGRSLGGGELVAPTLMALAGDGSVRVFGIRGRAAEGWRIDRRRVCAADDAAVAPASACSESQRGSGWARLVRILLVAGTYAPFTRVVRL